MTNSRVSSKWVFGFLAGIVGAYAILIMIGAFLGDETKNPKTALVNASEPRDPIEQLRLARAYLADPKNPYDESIRIQEIVPDTKQAVYWFRKSAEQGNSSAQISLGDSLTGLFGDGVPKDFNEALKWYRAAAKSGNAYAENRINGLRIILESPVRTDEDKRAVKAAFDAEK